MYLGVDVGGTKTLIALFTEKGELKESRKFETPRVYEDFLTHLAADVANLSTSDFKTACVAIPATIIDRTEGVGVAFGNLPWRNVTIQSDCEKLFNCPVLIENDAKLGGLSEAKLVIKEFKKCLYVTISTGIGIALIVDGVIDQNFGDSGGRTMMLEHNGDVLPWEQFASGKALTQKYGKLASELDDKTAWKELARNYAVGIIDLVALTTPDVIIIGGGVGAHFPKFEEPLKAILKSYETPLLPIPPIRRAKHPEEAVIYGCYELIKDSHGRPGQ